MVETPEQPMPDAEIERRRDEVVKRMLATPPQPKEAKRAKSKS